jgi:hypothetical protein
MCKIFSYLVESPNINRIMVGYNISTVPNTLIIIYLRMTSLNFHYLIYLTGLYISYYAHNKSPYEEEFLVLKNSKKSTCGEEQNAVPIQPSDEPAGNEALVQARAINVLNDATIDLTRPQMIDVPAFNDEWIEQMINDFKDGRVNAELLDMYKA